MSNFRIRAATLRDLEALVHQRHMMFEDIRHPTPDEHKVGDDSYREWLRGLMRRKLVRCYVVVGAAGKIVAGGCVWLRDEQPAAGRPAGMLPYILSMYTEPDFRRKGLATMVVKEAMRWAKSEGYRKMTLHASVEGEKVYAKLGWTRTREMEVDLREPPPGRAPPASSGGAARSPRRRKRP